MEDVAQAAGVAPATVYRHFRNFDALAQACAETAFNIVEIPTPEVAVAPFAERHLPAFDRTVSREERALTAIVTGLLEPAGADAVTRSVVVTLVDFPFWESLHRAGVPADRIPDLMFDLASDQLRRTGVNAERPNGRKQR